MTSGLLIVLFATSASIAQTSTPASKGNAAMVGTESKREFDSQNKKGAAAVGAVSATAAKLSASDQTLMTQVATGGMMQLEVSKVALQKATNPQVRQLAQAEVEEQTGLSAKLKEIAMAKGATLPSAPDAATKALVAKMQGLSGTAFDKVYVSESGVNGHQKLDKVLSSVEASGSDASLKGIAKAAHPLVKTHLQVAQQIMTNL